jgi:hypothetical protein
MKLQLLSIATATTLSLFSRAAFAFTLPACKSPSTLRECPTRLYSEASPKELSRRQLGELAIAGVGLGITYAGTRENAPQDYGLWGIVPVGTYKSKKTIRETIVPDQIWTLDQKFGILNVQVPQRTVIVRLKEGGLFVYNPVAATQECLGLVQELVDKYGPVKHIVLGSVALEHKAYTGVFAQKFPKAQVWVQPGQYSSPINLPTVFLGFPKGRTRTIPKTMEEAPQEWKDNFEFRILGPFISKDGAFGEAVFYHRATKTLICTDTVVEVSEEIPPIYDFDHAPLLYHARDTITDVVEDTPETLKKGWRRVQLFGLYFTPSAIDIKDAATAWKERRPDINPDFLGVYPWDWVRDDIANFKAISGGLLVAPILQTLILNRSPVETLDFADQVAKWPIERIIPGHLKNNLKYNGNDYRKAFSFLEAGGVPKGLPNPDPADLQTLRDAEANLVESGAIAKCPPMPGGKFSRDEIIAMTAYQCRAGVCAEPAKP